MMSNASSLILNFERLARKNLETPGGRVNKNSSSSPLDRTVAETPSPGGPEAFSPETVEVKALPKTAEKRAKPFDEASPDGQIDKDLNDEARDKMNKNTGPVNITGKKSSFHMRYLNQIANDVDSPDREPIPMVRTKARETNPVVPVKTSASAKAPVITTKFAKEKLKARPKAPLPFLSTGSPSQNTQIEKTEESFEDVLPPPDDYDSMSEESPPAKDYNSYSYNLTDEIARANEMGMAETLASVPESAQRALMMQTVTSPPSLMASPSSPTEFMNIPLSPVEDSNPIRPYSLFQSANKDGNNRSFDKIDQILAREISDAAEEATASIEKNLFKAKATVPTRLREWKAPEIIADLEEEDMELPFDCTVENDIRCLEEGGKGVTRKFVRKILRNASGAIAGVTVKKEHRGASKPKKMMGAINPLRDITIHPSETNSTAEKSRNYSEDDTFSPLRYNSSNDYVIQHTIRHGSDDGKESTSDKKQVGSRRRTVTYICVLVVLIVVGVFAGVVAGGHFWKKEESTNNNSNGYDYDEMTMMYTSTSTYTPTEFFHESNVFEGSNTVACRNAEPLTKMNTAYYGSNWKAFWDASIDTCGDQMSTGYAVWYSFSTNSSMLVEASTCNNADFDTQITVMSGSCGETTCVSFNDQACGDQSLVTWYAEANTTYYIMVHGFREASGTFGLTLSEASQNDQCGNAVSLQSEAVVAGTTAGANTLGKPPNCGDVDISSDGVWYNVGNVSGFYKAELLHGYTDFEGQIAVYRSMDNAGCTSLVCDRGSPTGSVTWLAEATDSYYLYVTGNNGTSGDFDLFLGRNKDNSCLFGTRLDANNFGFLASTEYENPQNVESCGYTGYHTAPGLWFSVMGTGEMLEASTCGTLLDLDTQISVFGNSCDTLECIGGTGQDLPCGDNGSVKWKSERGEVYNIYVSGRASRVGDFVLTINEVPEADGFTCDGSLPLELGSTSYQSNTTIAPSESVDLCTGSSAVRGVWHKFKGTGMTMKLSVCNDGTDFNARLSLFTGSCNELSCVAYTQSTCGDNDEILVTTHVGMDYYLFVHGRDSVSIGNYHLTIEETTINDSCAMSSFLELEGSPQYFGSTLSAGNSTALGCSGEVTSESVALWYTFVGTGESVTLSTCSSQTNFNTDIRIFSGSCSDFGCVSDITESDCDGKSMVSFQSAKDEIYYARIGGTNATDAGNFVLEVNPGSRFFLP